MRDYFLPQHTIHQQGRSRIGVSAGKRMWVRCYERYDSSPFPFTLVTHCTHRSSFPEYFTVLVPYLDQLRCSGLLVCVCGIPHIHTNYEAKNIALHLLRNTQLRGKRLFFWVKPRKRAVENEGGL